MINALQPILGKEWSGRVIFNMMSDRYTSIARLIIGVSSISNLGRQKINCIKEVRGITGLGLTEAKNLVEAAESYPQEFSVRPRPAGMNHSDWHNRIQQSIEVIRSAGYTIRL